MSGESDKKRRTVTTIETHEVWIVRRIVPGVADESQTLVPLEIPQTAASPLGEINHGEKQNKRTSHDWVEVMSPFRSDSKLSLQRVDKVRTGER